MYLKVEWEAVSIMHLHLYSNADPLLYKNTTQTVPNSKIPDEHWHSVSREGEGVRAQYNQLKKWSDNDEQFVRNVKLFKMVSEPVWEQMDL